MAVPRIRRRKATQNAQNLLAKSQNGRSVGHLDLQSTRTSSWRPNHEAGLLSKSRTTHKITERVSNLLTGSPRQLSKTKTPQPGPYSRQWLESQNPVRNRLRGLKSLQTMELSPVMKGSCPHVVLSPCTKSYNILPFPCSLRPCPANDLDRTDEAIQARLVEYQLAAQGADLDGDHKVTTCLPTFQCQPTV